jgi:tRNA-specific 2-thiouridylase
MKKKGIVLFSGGLDSQLAVKILQEQEIELIGINFLLPYDEIDSPNARKIKEFADSVGLKLRFEECSKEYIPVLKKPAHGYGKNINPCIDCKILFQKLAMKIMRKEDASFIATGEVNGQRPMSQRRDTIRHIEKESGADGYILRPLSIRFFSPTIAEKNGIVEREKLLSLHGRGRNEQLKLAEKYNILDYATPAGGCLFTEPNYSRKVKYLIDNDRDFTPTDLKLLKMGRHFEITPECRIIVTRNSTEAEKIVQYKQDADFTLEPDFKGPLVFGFGSCTESDYQTSADIAAFYGKPTETLTAVTVRNTSKDEILIPHEITLEKIDSLRI